MGKLTSNSAKVCFQPDLNILSRRMPIYKFKQDKFQFVYFDGKRPSSQPPKQIVNLNAKLTSFSPLNLRPRISEAALYKKDNSTITAFLPIYDPARLKPAPENKGWNQYVHFPPPYVDNQIAADPMSIDEHETIGENISLSLYNEGLDVVSAESKTHVEIQGIASELLSIDTIETTHDEIKTIEIEEELISRLPEELEEEKLYEIEKKIVNEPVTVKVLEDTIQYNDVSIKTLVNGNDTQTNDLKKILLIGGGIGLLVFTILAVLIFFPSSSVEKDRDRRDNLPSPIEPKVEETVIISKLVVANNLTGNTSLRAEKSENAAILLTIPNGDTVGVIKYASYYDVVDGVNGKWIYVDYRGKQGWCWGKDLALK